MSQELKIITINFLETKKYDFPINGKVSDIKLHYENIYGYEFYFKIIKGINILSDDFPIADIDEDITVVKLNITELLKQQKCSTIDESILPEGFDDYHIGNYYFITEDKCKIFLKNMIEIIKIDPSSILLKISKILDNAEDYLTDWRLTYSSYNIKDYIKFRENYDGYITPESVQFCNIPDKCINKYHINDLLGVYTFDFYQILFNLDSSYCIYRLFSIVSF